MQNQYPLRLSQIAKDYERIAQESKEGNIFRSKLSTDRRLELCIFEMVNKQQPITAGQLKSWHFHKYRSNANPINVKSIVYLWSKEITNYNIWLNRNQQKLKL